MRQLLFDENDIDILKIFPGIIIKGANSKYEQAKLSYNVNIKMHIYICAIEYRKTLDNVDREKLIN